jgi:hypothetical protein
MNAQVLFQRFNDKYWKGDLPHYNVLVNDKYYCGLCKKQERTIYINPATSESVPRTLLHEMAHAAVAGNEHRKAWLNEIRRLIRLGAPLKTELSLFARGKVIGPAQILFEIRDAGFEAGEDVTWQQVRVRLGYQYCLVDKQNRATNRSCAKLLQKMRREWLRGRREKRRFEKVRAANLVRMKAN